MRIRARALTAMIAVLAAVGMAAPAAAALQPYVFLLQWGSSGTAPGQFDVPIDGIVDDAGNVDVVDQGTSRIQKFTPDGVLLKSWGRACKLCTNFSSPTSIASGGGFLWLSDGGNDRLVKMDTAGNQLLDVPNTDPFYIAADSQGSVYVTHLFSHDVQVFNSSGTLVRTISTGFLVSAIDVTIGPDFTIYVLGSSSVSTDLHVEKFTRFGVPIGQFSVPPGVGAPGIAIDALQRLYVSDTSGTISVYTKTGGFLGEFGSFGSGPLQFKDPAVAAPDALGILYVVDRNNDRVQKLTETSSLIITVSDDVPPTPYTFTVTDGPTSVPSFQLDDDPASPLPGQRNITALVPGVYRVTIAGGPNTPKTITCSNGQQVTNYASSHIDVTVLAGQTVSCHFYVEWIG